jgi:hypothetical protein
VTVEVSVRTTTHSELDDDMAFKVFIPFLQRSQNGAGVDVLVEMEGIGVRSKSPWGRHSIWWNTKLLNLLKK